MENLRIKQGPVAPSNIQSPWARLAFFLLSVFWTAAGWMVLLQGGFHKTYKYSMETTFVGGAGGVLMAGLFLLLAAISAAIFLQSMAAHRLAFVVLGLALFVPPGLFLLGV